MHATDVMRSREWGDLVEEFHTTCNEAVAAVYATGWSGVWDGVCQRAGRSLADGTEDYTTVCRRIEVLADRYRRFLCDPANLDSLPRQRVLTRMDALRLLWTPTPTPSPQPHHPVWLRVVHFDDGGDGGATATCPVDGWSWGSTTAEASEKGVWRVPHNLGSGAHIPFHLLGSSSPQLAPCVRSIDLYLLAAAAQTQRWLSPTDAPLSPFPDDVVEHDALLAEACELERLACDEWGCPRSAPEVLDAALGRLVRQIQRHPFAEAIHAALRAWGVRVHLRHSLYVRFPRAFAAAMAECLAWVLTEDHPYALDRLAPCWDTERLGAAAAAANGASAHPLQAYGVWWLFGAPDGRAPSWEALTVGWDAEDHRRCPDRVLTPSVRRWWRAKLLLGRPNVDDK